MPILAGQILTAGQVARLQPVPYIAPASSPLAVASATYADIPGCSITFNTTAANAKYVANATFDCNVQNTSPTILMVGRLLVDGNADSGIAIKGMVVADRATVHMQWQGTLSAVGSHTLKLQGALTAALASGGTFQQTDTKLQVTILEVP
jgi:hypothetical protein